MTTPKEKLISGYRRFREGRWKMERDRWQTLAEGQSPRIMVIACSDSRVDPTLIFDAAPGELFIVRNVANLVPPFENDGHQHGVSAAVEFAVTQLLVEEIWVVGHAACGGVAAALSQQFAGAKPGEGGFLALWVKLLDAARARVIAQHGAGPAAQHALELEGIKVSLANLRSFPCIEHREGAGLLTLRGGYFAISEGKFHLFDEGKGVFLPV